MRGKSVLHREQIWKKFAVVCAAGTILFGSTQTVSGQATPCEARGKTTVPIRGKIFNNAVAPGTTLGTAHVRFGEKIKGVKDNGLKMECGLLGQDQSAMGSPGLSFLHTFVCDDKIPVPGTTDTIHSQLTVLTTGDGNFMGCPSPPFPAGAAYGSFWEVSTPIPGAGRGLFDGLKADEGEIHINGTINCLFAIDMEFDGWFCLP